MGPGGSTTLWSPEGNLGVQWRLLLDSKLGLWGPEGIVDCGLWIVDVFFHPPSVIRNLPSAIAGLAARPPALWHPHGESFFL